MLIPIKGLFKSLRLNTGCVVHVGAHMAEEMSLYLSLNLEPRVWIEAQPNLAKSLAGRTKEPNDVVIAGAAWSSKGISFDFNVASNTQASSVLEFGTLNDHYPDIANVESVKVESLILEDVLISYQSVTLLNLDIQGAELHALRGAGRELSKVMAIYTEVNFEEVYKECSLMADIDSYLEGFGFKRVLLCRTLAGWGDALYLHKDFKPSRTITFWLLRTRFKAEENLAQFRFFLRKFLLQR